MRLKRFRTDYATPQQVGRDLSDILNEEPTTAITLSTGTVSTVISNRFVGTGSVIAMMPTSSDAAAENYYITTTAGSFTITHSSGSSTRTFTYFVYG